MLASKFLLRTLRVCLTTSFVLGILLAATAMPAAAQSGGNTCIKETIGGNPPCSANDVRVGFLQLVTNENCVSAGSPFSCCTGNMAGTCDGGPTSCFLGEDIDVTLMATIESGPDRYAIGIWVNESGGSALSDPAGTCFRDYLHPFEDGYVRVEVPVIRRSGPICQAVTYISDRLTEDHVPYDWYRGLIVNGAKEVGLPANYVRRLEALPSRPDPKGRTR